MPKSRKIQHRYQRTLSPSLRSWEKPRGQVARKMKSDAVLEMGWGRLVFGHTFDDIANIAKLLKNEKRGKRDVAFYIPDPHVLLSLAPQDMFLDPSHTYRLWMDRYLPGAPRPKGLLIRRVRSRSDANEINRIYAVHGMVQADADFLVQHRNSRVLLYLVAEDTATGNIVGAMAGGDHERFFSDPERGASLWSLGVDPQAPYPGVGEAMVRYLAEHFQALGRAYMDLSVMHDNNQAVALYEKIGFQRVPVFCVKHKNPINEPLFVSRSAEKEEGLNPYAGIIVKEARRRGIRVEVMDAENGYFSLTFGGRSVMCRESLTELTSAVALSWCDDKAMTRKVLTRAGLHMPNQFEAGSDDENAEFLQSHGRVVVKPARGEQGRGIAVDVRTEEHLKNAVRTARKYCETVLIEEMVEGEDLRVVVIDYKVVAGAVRRPPEIVGTGKHTVKQLIEKLSRRRAAATGGESRIPLDKETERCVNIAGYDLEALLPAGQAVQVRKTANLHTGGTIHDVTDDLHPDLIQASELGARALKIPVVGLDLIVPKVDGPDYYMIEANERVGLANHEPQPTAERFIDLLFPQSFRK